MIDILMATHNGEEYIGQQLDSIFAQTNQDWQLLCRDDGSNDSTVSIVTQYMTRHPGRIKLLSDNKGRLGVGLNFGELLEHSNADYIMFADQDDVWLPEKIDRGSCHAAPCPRFS